MHPTYSQQIFQSLIVFSTAGSQYSPVQPAAQLISTTVERSFQACAMTCNRNVMCRVFDYDVNQPYECRLFEGDVNVLGSVVSSSSSSSVVGSVKLSSNLFSAYGQSCAASPCLETRYLQCGSALTCECVPHTYWSPSQSICLPQTPVLGAPCEADMNMCRADLNYICLQFNQCGPLSVLSGTTLIDNNTVFDGSSRIGLGAVGHLALTGLPQEALIVADAGFQRIIQVLDIGSNNYNISILAQNWTTGPLFTYPIGVTVDGKNGNNLYVSDWGRSNVLLFSATQNSSSSPILVAGGTHGSGLSQFINPVGVKIDNQSNIIVADSGNHRVVLWTPTATTGIVLAGLNVNGNDAQSLYLPFDIFLDQKNAWLYVADTLNARIQRFSLYDSMPRNGTTVAGGHGGGSGSHQFSIPFALWVSKKTGAIYVVDQKNNRIQRWAPNATKGVTIAGSPLGIPGSTSTLLFDPCGIAINADETIMYVSDDGNKRVQKFQLI